MRRFLLTGLACLTLFSPSAFAAKWNAADFPLRVHIVQRNGFRHYHGFGGGMSTLQAVDGMGVANLFENGQPLGFQFNYQCDQPITPETAYETFMARWKKPGRELEILLPVIGGRPGDMNSCNLKVTMKQDTVYVLHDGVGEEPAAQFKAWMEKNQYDPEHGRDEPVSPAAANPPQATPPQGQSGNSANAQP